MLPFTPGQLLAILLSVGTVYSFYRLCSFRQLLKLSLPAVCLVSVLHTLMGVLCVKVFAVLETFDLSKAGNMSLFGGVFFMPVLYYAGARLSKRKITDVFDVFTPCMVFTVLCARINCVLTGCCKGMRIPGFGDFRWPTRELEIIFYLILLAYFHKKDKQKMFQQGMYYPIYMAAYGAFRFLTEGFRESDSGSLIHISHFWAAIAFGLGFSIYSEIKRKRGGK